ncbi:hypothetical protein BC939DRAFT_489769 [Gamsiella multidivaricata]|uniref:uncharacterized protein n=1 Tax=Gamsiella multidivaricata TaxID=101098 RepID=UPI002220C910|nr:uncharacterized protein BC939DRAFT_489769 [Gamsiella multidivaricata]KAI7830383.1 hypothetical protein BC939DRAFT_489769 [Gamsiella multidivaricata]
MIRDDSNKAADPATESLKQRVRNENRERKKRWREQNEERNKDNDLRCRVHKRANKLFALALSDLVKKNGSHLDLAQLTGVLTDPDLARQLIEIEANNPIPPPSAAMMVLNAPVKPGHEIKTSHMLEADYPMDAVLTLMQLNGAWKA